ncbi:MAG: hypothetical protein ACP5JG_10260, partial [Anaerolineae bacterium]
GQTRAWHRVAQVTVPDVAYRPLPHALTALIGRAAWLVGIRAPGEVAAGSTFNLDLALHCRYPMPQGARPQLRWIDIDGSVALDQALAPLGASPAGLCSRAASAPVVRRYPVAAPEEPGRYRLTVGWRDVDGDFLSARCRWLSPLSNACSVGFMTVAPADIGLANYGGNVLLLDAELDAGDVPAGGQLRLNLVWRALQEMTKDYTVFVQVLGPDGKLYGQVDSQPVQGARPTSGWSEGEELRDAYAFYVDAGGPAGVYRVIVGWYLLEDMTRLPVVDAEGREVGDYYEVGSFTLP